MPELKLPGVRLRGFRDMSADDVRQALADVPRPDVKLSDLDPRKVDLSKVQLPSVDLPSVDLSKLDLGRVDLAGAASSAATAAAERNPLRRRPSRRRPILIAGIVAAVIGILAIANAGWIRARAAELGQRVRSRMDADRVDDALEPLDADEEAFSGAVGIPIQPDAYADTLPPAEGGSPTEAPVDIREGVASGYSSDRDNGSDVEEGEVRLYGG